MEQAKRVLSQCDEGPLGRELEIARLKEKLDSVATVARLAHRVYTIATGIIENCEYIDETAKFILKRRIESAIRDLPQMPR